MASDETVRRREYHRLYHLKNKAKRQARYQERRAADPEAWKAKQRAYYEAHRDRIREVDRERYERTREEQIANAKKWAEANPDRRREIVNGWDRRNPERRRARQGKRRARMRGSDAEHVHPLVVLERDDGLCGICGEDVDPFNFHVDHIVPLARGGSHTYLNTQVAHPTCNLAKGADPSSRIF